MTRHLRLLPQQLTLFDVHERPQPLIRVRLDEPDGCCLCGCPTTRGEWFPAFDGFPEATVGFCLPCWLDFRFRQRGVPFALLAGLSPEGDPSHPTTLTQTTDAATRPSSDATIHSRVITLGGTSA